MPCASCASWASRKELAALAIPTAELAYFSRHGKPIWREPRGREAGYRWPQFSIHRGALQMLLLHTLHARLGPDVVRFNRHLTDFSQTGDGITAIFTARDGTAASRLGRRPDRCRTASTRRCAEKFNPGEGPPIWNGAILWRGVTEAAPSCPAVR